MSLFIWMTILDKSNFSWCPEYTPAIFFFIKDKESALIWLLPSSAPSPNPNLGAVLVLFSGTRNSTFHQLLALIVKSKDIYINEKGLETYLGNIPINHESEK